MRQDNHQLAFCDDIDGLAGEEQELADLVESLDKTSTSYGMEISAEKTKLMTSIRNGIATDIRARGEKLETVNNFKYLGAVVTDEGSKPEIMSRIAQTSAAMKRLKTIWNDKNITQSQRPCHQRRGTEQNQTNHWAT